MSDGERDLGVICGCQTATLGMGEILFGRKYTDNIEEFKGRPLLRGVGKDKGKKKKSSKELGGKLAEHPRSRG